MNFEFYFMQQKYLFIWQMMYNNFFLIKMTMIFLKKKIKIIINEFKHEFRLKYSFHVHLNVVQIRQTVRFS